MKKRKVVKRRLRTLVAAVCTLALVVMPALPAWGTDLSSGEMAATSQVNADVTVGTKPAHRIDSFNLDGKFFYKSLGNDNNKPTLTMSTSQLQNIVKNQLLPQWSPVAASVFRDQAGQLVDLYGYSPNGGSMSQAGFDAYFNMSNGPKDYKDETWSCYNLKSKLEQTWATHAGKPGWDQLYITGVKQVGSLKDARKMVGQALRDCQNNGSLSVDDFLNVSESGGTRLEGLDDEKSTTGFANVVTAINCKGSSADFDYVSFGIVFYDFEMVPVAANGLTYQSGELKSDVAEKGHVDSTVSNSQQQTIAHSAALGDSVTETTTTTLSGLASASMKQKMGGNISYSSTEFSSETEFWADDDSAGASTSGSSETTTLGFNWSTAWEMAGAAGAEAGHSKSEQVSKAVETTIALPPQTATTLDSTTTTTTYTQYYQQPVVLNYKVAIYAVSGDYYCSSTFGGMGGINPSQYDKQSLVIKFDTKDDKEDSYGCAATDDLYSRAITNRNIADYDVAFGRTYTSHSTAKGFNKSDDINWDNVINTAKNYYGVEIVGNVNAPVGVNDANAWKVKGAARTNYFYETLGKLNVNKDKTSSTVKELRPLHNLTSVTTPKTDFTLYSGNTLDLKSLTLKGLNKNNVAFYGFDSSWGEWKLCDEHGMVRENQTPTSTDPIVASTFTSSQTLEPVTNFATETKPTIYLTWVPKENEKPITEESPNGQNLYEDYNADPKKIKTPVITVVVKNAGLDNPTVTASGSYTGFYGTPINLNDVMTYEVRDSTTKKVDTQVKWECDEFVREGIAVSNDTGYAVFTKPGTYHVRAYVMKNVTTQGASPEKAYSDWITVTATEHNLTHYEAKDPTDCTAGNEDGWKEHYRCSCHGKYFSDAEGKNEIPAADVIVKLANEDKYGYKDPDGHTWGEWTDVPGSPGVQQRVCEHRSSHVQTRNLYTVKFNTNKPAEATDVPDPEAVPDQTVVSGTSAKVPTEPAIAGYKFEGWCTDKAGNNPYDFNSTVNSNVTLYAKWSRTTFAVASTAIVYIAGNDGEQKVLPAAGCYVSVAGGQQTQQAYTDDEGYNYRYMEVAPGTKVTLTVNPGEGGNYTFTDDGENIQAVQVNSDLSTASSDLSGAKSVELTKKGSNTYEFTMPAADVATVANVTQNKVTVKYDENLPADTPAGTHPERFPEQPSAPIDNGAAFTLPTQDPTLSWTVQDGTTQKTVTYFFGGWYTDKACTQPFLNNSKVTRDTTLYAKWTKGATGPNAHTVTYTVHDIAGSQTASYTCSYKAEDGSAAYDPTNDLYAYVGTELLKEYGLQEASNGSHWYTDAACTDAYDFTQSVTADLTLHAQVVPKKYTVSYFNDEEPLGTQSVTYNTAIGTIDKDVKTPEKDGCSFSKWVTKDGSEWNLTTSAVTSDQALYAAYTIEVTFDNNGHGNTPAAQTVASGGTVNNPGNLTADGYTFGGWFTDAACTKAYDFNSSVTNSMTLYAKWTAEKRTVTFNANGHGTAPEAQDVDYNSKATRPTPDPTTDGYTFGGWYKEAACTTAYDFATPVTANLTLYAKWTEKATPAPAPEPEPEAEGVSMFRMYNPNSGEHFYTSSSGERDMLVGVGWSYEGVGWTAPESSSTPVYRLYNANGGEHHYTMSETERDMLVGVGWSDEGIGWYSDDEQRVPLFRDYNPNAFANNHNYTTSSAEHEMLLSVGWRPEGYAWYGM